MLILVTASANRVIAFAEETNRVKVKGGVRSFNPFQGKPLILHQSDLVEAI